MANDVDTRFGRLLRRCGLNKAPLLLNILKGEMSLIGPFPEQPEVARRLEQEIPLYNARTLMKPGVSGWGFIHYRRDIRCAVDSLRRLGYDLYYIQYASLTLDVSIAFKTISAILRWS